MTRRDFAACLAGVAAAASPPAIRLHASNYGMQTLPAADALAVIRDVGYDGMELCAMPDWPSAPARLFDSARRALRASGFPFPTIIDAFHLLAPEAEHAAALGRIHADAQLAHDISPERPPLLQTVLGGRPGQWPEVRARMAARLAEWARAAHEARITLAVKAHANQAVDTPDKLLALLDDVRHPALAPIYDYSHFQLRGLAMAATMEALLPRAAFLTVKDSRVSGGKAEFLLPGQGSIDYLEYFRLVKQKGWRGWVLVEVSRQLQTQPGYDGARAAAMAYAHLAPILRDLGLRGA
jgi:sugar phosphate isomerase/epimerase